MDVINESSKNIDISIMAIVISDQLKDDHTNTKLRKRNEISHDNDILLRTPDATKTYLTTEDFIQYNAPPSYTKKISYFSDDYLESAPHLPLLVESSNQRQDACFRLSPRCYGRLSQPSLALPLVGSITSAFHTSNIRNVPISPPILKPRLLESPSGGSLFKTSIEPISPPLPHRPLLNKLSSKAA
jgi:hypothetical protein